MWSRAFGHISPNTCRVRTRLAKIHFWAFQGQFTLYMLWFALFGPKSGLCRQSCKEPRLCSSVFFQIYTLTSFCFFGGWGRGWIITPRCHICQRRPASPVLPRVFLYPVPSLPFSFPSPVLILAFSTEGYRLIKTWGGFYTTTLNKSCYWPTTHSCSSAHFTSISADICSNSKDSYLLPFDSWKCCTEVMGLFANQWNQPLI